MARGLPQNGCHNIQMYLLSPCREGDFCSLNPGKEKALQWDFLTLHQLFSWHRIKKTCVGLQGLIQSSGSTRTELHQFCPLPSCHNFSLPSSTLECFPHVPTYFSTTWCLHGAPESCQVVCVVGIPGSGLGPQPAQLPPSRVISLLCTHTWHFHMFHHLLVMETLWRSAYVVVVPHSCECDIRLFWCYHQLPHAWSSYHTKGSHANGSLY